MVTMTKETFFVAPKQNQLLRTNKLVRIKHIMSFAGKCLEKMVKKELILWEKMDEMSKV